VDALLAESLERTARLERAEAESRDRSAQVELLSEVGRALQRTMEIDEILRVILTAVTAGDGLGFNRAFLLLVDEAGSTIRGRTAVGPSSADEAELIWRAMRDQGRSLGEMLSGLPPGERTGRGGIVETAERMVFSASPDDNVMARSLEESRSFIITRAHERHEARRIASAIASDHFLVVPLVAEGKKLGAILADNFVTGRPILQDDVRLAESFASQAALALLNASLHRRLQARVGDLERANQELTHQHLQLLTAERLVAAGGLAATLVHDLKAPVVSIGLMAKAAASGLAGGGPMKETLERIAKEIVRVEEYLRDFARSAGNGSKRLEKIDFEALLLECLGMLHGAMVKAKVEVVTDFKHGGVRVSGSRMELRQMIVNILHNSIEAMPDGGRIAVATSVAGRMVAISVEDTGRGIPERHQARVFSPFFTTKAEGSGLGLVLAKRIVTGHGGKISLRSREGVGTCIMIELPACRSEEHAA
jgi:signal transduction histidine kinase